MRAATIRDKAIVIEEHPDPVAGAGEVLVRVRAAGLNGADPQQVKGWYPPPPGAPQDIPGMEIAGEVVALGPGLPRFAVGDRVMAIVAGGGQAELINVNDRVLMPVPEGLSWAQAGGLPETFTTAYDAIVSQATLRPGERLLIHGAAGGVGNAAIQIGKAFGAHVTASCRHPGLFDELRELGADVVVEPGGESELEPFDVILELVGATNLEGNIKALATGGRIAVVGVGSGVKAELNLLGLMQKRARISGATLRPRSIEQKATLARLVEHEVLPFFAGPRPQMHVPVAATFQLEHAAAAYERFTAGAKFGKVVLELG